MFNGISQVGYRSNVVYYLSQIAQLTERIALVSWQLGTPFLDSELSPVGRQSRDSYLRQERLKLQSERQVVYDEFLSS